MLEKVLVSAAVFTKAFLLMMSVAIAQEQTAFELYKDGEIAKARAEFKAQLRTAEQQNVPANLWRVLMNFAWFENEVSEYEQAIEYSNRALKVATSLNKDLMIGRSLCWLGWSYASLGLYDLALSFYENAVEIGAPDGEIQIVPVWGLATQEIGAIYFKTGDSVGARKKLKETFGFAKRLGIFPGIAEGGAHLAELALVEGSFAEAEDYAIQALEAAKKCGCSPYNISRAKLVQAKVSLERAKHSSELFPAAKQMIEDTIDHCDKSGHLRCRAEAKILLAKCLPNDKIKKRLELLKSAFESLANAKSELRGLAEASLGRMYMENQQLKLAEFYLTNGYRVNKELFRRIDNAYISVDLAKLRGLKGEVKVELERLSEAADRALNAGALLLAAKTQAQLADKLRANGYKTMALDWSKRALRLVESLLEKNPNTLESPSLEEEQLRLSEQIALLGVELTQERSMGLEHLH